MKDITIFFIESTLARIESDHRDVVTFSFPMDKYVVQENFLKLDDKLRNRVLKIVSMLLDLKLIHHKGYTVEGPELSKADETEYMRELELTIKPHIKTEIKDLSGGTVQAIGLFTALLINDDDIHIRYPEAGIHPLSAEALGKIMLGTALRIRDAYANFPIDTGLDRKIIVETRSPFLMKGLMKSHYIKNEDVRKLETFYLHGKHCKKMKLVEFKAEHEYVNSKT
jgi:hypothetical protein